MASANVELARRFIVAFNARDVESVLALCHPRLEYETAFADLGGIYIGHNGIRTWHGDFQEVWGAEIRVEPEAYFDLGEHTLTCVVLHGRGAQSGTEVAMPLAVLGRWHNGLLVYGKGYVARDDVLSDLGVAEDELEPIAP